MGKNNDLTLVFMTIKNDYPNYLYDDDKLLSIFSDLAPGLQREKKILRSFISCGGLSVLKQCREENSPQEIIRQKVKTLLERMYDEDGIAQENAYDICASFGIATGLRMPTSQQILLENRDMQGIVDNQSNNTNSATSQNPPKANNKPVHKTTSRMQNATKALLVVLLIVVVGVVVYTVYISRGSEEGQHATAQNSNFTQITGSNTSTRLQDEASTPTKKPTATPTKKPTATPTKKPTATPTVKPTATPKPQNMDGANKEKLGWSLLDGVLIISGQGEMADYEYNGAPWYNQRDQIIEIIVERGISTIGKYSFFECSNLQSVVLPTTLKRINDNAFMYCYSLPTLSIPEGVQYIGESIIYRNPSLREVNLPKSLIAIGGSFAGECPNLRSITVASGNKNFVVVNGVLFDAAMEELICHPAALSDIQYDIPSGVKTIGVYAFAANNNLVSVTIPNTVTTIDSCAFTECSKLKSISIPNSVKRLGIYAFCDCTSLTSVEMSDNITSIDQQAFSRCYKLEELVLPKKLTTIGSFVFLGSSNLTRIYVPSTVKSINNNAFEDCPDVTIYCESGSYAQSYAKKNNIPYKTGKFK